MAMDRLRRFFHPRGIAVFGSMTEGWFFGGAVVIKELQALGYQGAICPIHPTARTVYGLKVYPDISQVGAEVDLAVIATMWAYGPSSEAVARLGDLAEQHGIPFYPTTRRAVFALGYLAGYARRRDRVLARDTFLRQ